MNPGGLTIEPALLTTVLQLCLKAGVHTRGMGWPQRKARPSEERLCWQRKHSKVLCFLPRAHLGDISCLGPGVQIKSLSLRCPQ